MLAAALGFPLAQDMPPLEGVFGGGLPLPLLLGMASAMAALFSGWVVSGFWERSISLLASYAQRITEGDYSVRFGEFSGMPELGGLCASLQKLLEVREQQGRDLRETLRHFHGTFENAAIGVFHLTRNGGFQRVNQRFCGITGHPREGLLRKKLKDLACPEDSLFLEGRMRALFEEGLDCFSVEKRLVHASGALVWVRLTATLMRDERSQPEYAIAFLEDVSARRHAEEELLRSEASMRSLMDCSRDSCVALLDLRGEVLSIHPKGLGLLRTDPTEVCAKGWVGLWSVSENGGVEAALEEARIGGVGRFRGQRVMSEAGMTWWEVTLTAIPGPGGSAERLLSVARDVTLQHAAVEALQHAKESAEAASRAKDELLSALSHELRTPLNPVLLLAGEYARSVELPAHMREDFALIHRNVRLEARLIDDLLDLTKIQRAGLSVSKRLLDLGSLVAQVCEGVRAEAGEKQVRLELERGEVASLVRGDATRLHQIFANLILNAVKFSAAGGEVRLKLSQEGARVRVAVSDGGIGIASEEMGRIFEPFAQGCHARESQRYGGLGLGLAIAKMLVERHRGKIWAESLGRGQGATFYVELPLEPQERAEILPLPSATEIRARPVRARRILLVEDHDATRATLARMLSRRGHLVTQAETLCGAAVLARSGIYDVLISDIGLPDGNGSDLIREYGDRFLEGGIALSGFGMEAEVARSLHAGFKRHLTKPIEVEALEETLQALEAPETQGRIAV